MQCQNFCFQVNLKGTAPTSDALISYSMAIDINRAWVTCPDSTQVKSNRPQAPVLTTASAAKHKRSP